MSSDLLIKWLTQYEFKSWTRTETQEKEVTGTMKEERAREIAALLNGPEKWHSHGRAIDARVLREDVNIKIESFEEDVELSKEDRDCYRILRDYMHRENILSFVHTREYF